MPTDTFSSLLSSEKFLFATGENHCRNLKLVKMQRSASWGSPGHTDISTAQFFYLQLKKYRERGLEK